MEKHMGYLDSLRGILFGTPVSTTSLQLHACTIPTDPSPIDQDYVSMSAQPEPVDEEWIATQAADMTRQGWPAAAVNTATARYRRFNSPTGFNVPAGAGEVASGSESSEDEAQVHSPRSSLDIRHKEAYQSTHVEYSFKQRDVMLKAGMSEQAAEQAFPILSYEDWYAENVQADGRVRGGLSDDEADDCYQVPVSESSESSCTDDDEDDGEYLVTRDTLICGPAIVVPCGCCNRSIALQQADGGQYQVEGTDFFVCMSCPLTEHACQMRLVSGAGCEQCEGDGGPTECSMCDQCYQRHIMNGMKAMGVRAAEVEGRLQSITDELAGKTLSELKLETTREIPFMLENAKKKIRYQDMVQKKHDGMMQMLKKKLLRAEKRLGHLKTVEADNEDMFLSIKATHGLSGYDAGHANGLRQAVKSQAKVYKEKQDLHAKLGKVKGEMFKEAKAKFEKEKAQWMVIAHKNFEAQKKTWTGELQGKRDAMEDWSEQLKAECQLFKKNLEEEVEDTILSKISTAERDKKVADLRANDLMGIITQVEERAEFETEKAATMQKKYDTLLQEGLKDSGPYEAEIDRLREYQARAANEMTAQVGAAMKKLEVTHIEYRANVQGDMQRLKTQLKERDEMMKAVKDEHAAEIRALKKSLGLRKRERQGTGWGQKKKK